MTASHGKRSGPPSRGAFLRLLSVYGSESSVTERSSTLLTGGKPKSYSRDMSIKRERPAVTVTLDPEVRRRILAVAEALPGATFSGVIDELAQMSLPAMEAMVSVLQESRSEDGVVDEERAKDALARWAGAQLLGLSHTEGDELEEEE